MSKKAALYTLGCKLNQYETMFLQEQLEKCGYLIVPFESVADLYVINTCTVTNKGDYHSRMKIRQAQNTNPDALIVATGCSAQVNPQRLAAIPGVSLVLGNSEKGNMIHYLASLKKNGIPDIRVSSLDQETVRFQPLFIENFSGYTRAFLKIQEGCSHRCSYCIVPTARGKNRSARYGDALAQARQLVENGYKELVLTGIHLGTYGQDLEEKKSLSDLIEAMLLDQGCCQGQDQEPFRLRISSIEPTEITPHLKRLIAQSPRICAHLHIPLQSGDDQTLRAMHRPYTCAFYQELIEELVSLRPEITIGADVMVGFPGESDDEFEESLRLYERIEFDGAFTFAYSPRPGTQAAAREDQVPVKTRLERLQRLIDLQNRITVARNQTEVGRVVEVLVDGRAPRGEGLLAGRARNNKQVIFAGDDSLAGYLVRVRITSGHLWGLRGDLVNS